MYPYKVFLYYIFMHMAAQKDIEDPMEEDIDVPEEIQAPENSNVDEEFGMHDIVE